MSLIQVELLRRKQGGASNSAELDYPLGATINGIAAGLHNNRIACLLVHQKLQQAWSHPKEG